MNKRVPNDSCESAFKFLVRNACVKGRKIKGLDVCDMEIIGRTRLSDYGMSRYFAHFKYSEFVKYFYWRWTSSELNFKVWFVTFLLENRIE